jgi:hypothetical protein
MRGVPRRVRSCHRHFSGGEADAARLTPHAAVPAYLELTRNYQEEKKQMSVMGRNRTKHFDLGKTF